MTTASDILMNNINLMSVVILTHERDDIGRVVAQCLQSHESRSKTQLTLEWYNVDIVYYSRIRQQSRYTLTGYKPDTPQFPWLLWWKHSWKLKVWRAAWDIIYAPITCTVRTFSGKRHSCFVDSGVTIKRYDYWLTCGTVWCRFVCHVKSAIWNLFKKKTNKFNGGIDVVVRTFVGSDTFLYCRSVDNATSCVPRLEVLNCVTMMMKILLTTHIFGDT